MSVRRFEFAAGIEYLRARCCEIGTPLVLDLGCGTGQTLIWLTGHIRIGIGVDISPGMISHAQKSGADLERESLICAETKAP